MTSEESGNASVLDIRELRFCRAQKTGSAQGFQLEIERLLLKPGDSVGITGPSGSGKSTLLDLFALLRAPDVAGGFRFLGTDIVALWKARRISELDGLRARNIGVVLQTGGLLPALSVIENIMLPRRLLGDHDVAPVIGFLDALGLSGLAHRLPSQISVGQRQRVAIARAVAHHPRLILADEPTAALGRQDADGAMRLLTDLARTIGAVLIVVSHDLPMLDRVGLLPLALVDRQGCAVLEQWP